MNWKGYGMKQIWANFKVLSQHLPGGTEENQLVLGPYNQILNFAYCY
jgi:hypothetical protein